MTTQCTDTDISCYSVISKIGEGGFSKVYLVKDQQTNEHYAAKVAKFMIDDDTKESEEVKSLFREVNLMSLFNHPSILKFFGYYSTNFEDEPVPTMITELASNGSLRYIIELETSGDQHLWNCIRNVIFTQTQRSSSRFKARKHFNRRLSSSENFRFWPIKIDRFSVN